MNMSRALSSIVLVLVLCCSFVGAEPPATQPDMEAQYEKTIYDRATKIVEPLALEDAQKSARVHLALTDFYRSLRDWHDANGEQRKALKSRNTPEAKDELARLDASLAVVREKFLSQLSEDLTGEQIVRVKDGLTYNVVHVTYGVYNELLPELTEDQKAQIMAWLVEGRELAISEGSSDAKHAMFGKYKGRINNYLAKAGYDMKAAEKALQAKKRAEREAATKPG